MSVGQTVGVALLVSLLALVLRESKSGIAPLFLLLGGFLLLGAALSRAASLSAVLSFFSTVGLEEETETVVKVLSVGLLTSLGAEACTELGAPTVASKLELCGRVEILVLALPTLQGLLTGILALLSS